jgi:type I restriction enzyme M protein
VGVLIEEDGLTEAEFIVEMKERHTVLNKLNEKANELEKMINENINSI